ncbi:hypothetical protein MASR2M66_21950 [Chloroflexota bacterium]
MKVGLLVGSVALISFYVFFALTGGHALSRVVWHHFLREIPNKEYSWRDFTDRGAREGISGFYAYGDAQGFSMWTLSGLKTYSHIPSTSIYQHEDICGALRVFNVSPQDIRVPATQEVTNDILRWQSLIKQENLVTVVRMNDEEGSNWVDKVWSYSGKYKILNRLDEESCE